MPHVDEGTLHALLDGALRAESPGRASEVEAHLAACGDCRARLEAAEELRGEASGILDAAIADDLGATPDFSDVVRRAEVPAAPGVRGAGRPGSQPDRLRRQARWTRGVAWAASLVLALGTGYLIRDLTGPAIDDAPSAAVRSEAVEDAPAGSGAVAGEEADRAAADPAAGEATDAGNADADDGADARMRASRSEEPSVGRTAAAPGEGATTESAEAEREAAEPVPPAPIPTPAPERMAEADAATKQAESRDPDSAASRTRAAAPEAERVPDRVEAESVEGIRVTALGQAASRWSPVTAEEAREILDGPLYLLPRAQFQTLYKRTDAGREQVLSLQKLQTGVPIQVLQWRGDEEGSDGDADQTQATASIEGAAPTADTALPFAALPDANVVRVVRDEYILELTGSLPAALLSVLGETAGPAP